MIAIAHVSKSDNLKLVGRVLWSTSQFRVPVRGVPVVKQKYLCSLLDYQMYICSPSTQ